MPIPFLYSFVWDKMLCSKKQVCYNIARISDIKTIVEMKDMAIGIMLPEEYRINISSVYWLYLRI